MELDAVASKIVLENLSRATPSHWTAKVEELRRLHRQGGAVSLAGFLRETGLEVADVYAGSKSWSDLLSDAGIEVLPAGPQEQTLRRACGRLLHVNDAERLRVYGAMLKQPSAPDVEATPERQRRLLRMLVASLTDRVLDKSATLSAATALLWDHPQIRAELLGEAEQRYHRAHRRRARRSRRSGDSFSGHSRRRIASRP
jgi:hypothetical protein